MEITKKYYSTNFIDSVEFVEYYFENENYHKQYSTNSIDFIEFNSEKNSILTKNSLSLSYSDQIDLGF